MSTVEAIGAGLGFIVGVFLFGWAIFTLGLFPNLITFLQHIRWINLTSDAINALYWTIVFAWLLGCFRGVKIKS
jgi:hypothetical protein